MGTQFTPLENGPRLPLSAFQAIEPLPQLRRMCFIVRSTYEQTWSELCIFRDLFPLPCRGKEPYNELTPAYSLCLCGLKLKTGKWASKPTGWMDSAVPPTAIELHY